MFSQKKYANGIYEMKNPQKYSGNKSPRYRSGWEHAFMRFCDNHPSVVNWASEAIQIPYRNPLTGKGTVYVPDFFIVYVDKNGKKNADLIEVKPKSQTNMVDAGKSFAKKKQVALNMAKWEAANAYAKQNKIRFRVLSEDQLFHNGTRK